MSRAFEVLEVASKKGSILAHNLLALYEEEYIGNIDKSINHRKVAASAGHKEAMDTVMEAYKDKLLSKEDLTQTLRAFQASNDLLKNKDRDDAKAAVGYEYYPGEEAE